jgi:hypothetical protein
MSAGGHYISRRSKNEGPGRYVRGVGATRTDGKLGASDRDPKTTLGVPERLALI